MPAVAARVSRSLVGKFSMSASVVVVFAPYMYPKALSLVLVIVLLRVQASGISSPAFESVWVQVYKYILKADRRTPRV